MSETAQNPEQQQQVYTLSRNSTATSSSASLIKLDELSPFGATKQNRLPALIKLNQVDDSKEQENGRKTVSMPIFNGSEIEQESEKGLEKREASLPAEMKILSPNATNEKYSKSLDEMERKSEDFSELQINGLSSSDLIGPSLPAPNLTARELASAIDWSANAPTNQFDDNDEQHQQQPQDDDLVGDSLIEMIINLRNENQDLIRALETNNEYVKQRLDDFKRVNEELKQQDAKFALERLDYEQKLRKLQHENIVLSDKLKTMEAKLTDAKCDVKDSFNMADSRIRSSQVGNDDDKMYPDLSAGDSNNLDMQQMVTMQAGSEPTNSDDRSTVSSRKENGEIAVSDAQKVGEMSFEELSKRFDAIKTDFYASDDRMEQCDKLEKQLNDIGTRDYEICLLQQQLNIYRQDFRLERMANLEAKLQIERIKNDIDKLCLERLKDKSRMYGSKGKEEEGGAAEEDNRNKPTYRPGSHVRFGPGAAAEAVVTRLGHQLSKKAARSAAKAAKYASKQAYREERAAAAAAVAAAAAANPEAYDASSGHHSHRRHHSQHYHRGHHRGIKSEVVSDLLSTANKAMLTGYKMASNHVNMALDRLNQPAANEQTTTTSSSSRQDGTGKRVEPSAPPMSLD